MAGGTVVGLISGVAYRQHIYLAVLIATFIEGMGLPLPAEVLYVAAGVLIKEGSARLGMIILVGAFGNLLGSMTGFGLAYVGGQALIRRMSRLVGIKPEAVARVEEFFAKYGAATVFLSRFVGVIRAATVYMAGAARMQPWQFAFYLFAGALIWNGGWAYLAFRFGEQLHHLVRSSSGRVIVWSLLAVGIYLAIRYVVRWHRRRNPRNS